MRASQYTSKHDDDDDDDDDDKKRVTLHIMTIAILETIKFRPKYIFSHNRSILKQSIKFDSKVSLLLYINGNMLHLFFCIRIYRAHGNTVARRRVVSVRRESDVPRRSSHVYVPWALFVCICARGRSLILLFFFSPLLPPLVPARPRRGPICGYALNTQSANNSPLTVGRTVIFHFGRELIML